MQPYQRATEEVLRQEERPIHLAKSIGKTALNLAAGSAIGSKIVPFLSQYIPEDIMIKGLSFIDPRLGKFVKGSIEAGKSAEEVKEFLGEKVKQQEQEDMSPEAIITYSPEIHSQIMKYLERGVSPRDTAMILDKSSLSPLIRRIERDRNMAWPDIVESVYGNVKTRSPSNHLQNMAQPASQPPPNAGPGQQALAAILERINQRLSK